MIRSHEGCLRVFVALCVVVSSPAGWAQTQVADARRVLDRAVEHFEAGRIAESVAAFDEVVRLVPDQAPFLWQRGIALYYASRYSDCRAQFESHRRVNPNDVEPAAWHFLCVARAESPAKARAALLPVGPDPRPPMRQIYDMFRGDTGAAAVLAAAGTRPDARFYAYLYVGLYSEAVGDAAGARRHMETAAQPRYSASGGYMPMVARVHTALNRAGRP